MLTKRRLAEFDGVTVVDVRCHEDRRSWSDPESSGGYGLVLVRQGSFRRRVNGGEELIDPGVAYFERPDEEQQVAHHSQCGDTCTSLSLGDDVVAGISGGDPHLPGRPAIVDPRVDLQHRLMVSSCRRGDLFDIAERTILLVTTLVEQVEAARIESGRPGTHKARRRIVDEAREALVADPTIGLVDLARSVAVSPHHLSRIFRAITGESLSHYRRRLRVGQALDRLADEEPSLSDLAADLGFADHSHMGRVIKRELGHTPSWLRSSLASDP